MNLGIAQPARRRDAQTGPADGFIIRRQIRNACVWLRDKPESDTRRFTEYVAEQAISNGCDQL